MRSTKFDECVRAVGMLFVLGIYAAAFCFCVFFVPKCREKISVFSKGVTCDVRNSCNSWKFVRMSKSFFNQYSQSRP